VKFDESNEDLEDWSNIPNYVIETKEHGFKKDCIEERTSHEKYVKEYIKQMDGLVKEFEYEVRYDEEELIDE
jgi:hypothetical protein